MFRFNPDCVGSSSNRCPSKAFRVRKSDLASGRWFYYSNQGFSSQKGHQKEKGCRLPTGMLDNLASWLNLLPGGNATAAKGSALTTLSFSARASTPVTRPPPKSFFLSSGTISLCCISFNQEALLNGWLSPAPISISNLHLHFESDSNCWVCRKHLQLAGNSKLQFSIS
jgi:hypothetical protein